MSVEINGNGTFVEIVKGIIDAMTPATSSYKIDITPCLPNPSVPNTDRYVQIRKSKIFFSNIRRLTPALSVLLKRVKRHKLLVV